VIESLDELPAALGRASALQPQFEGAQRLMSAASIDHADVPASERQARAIHAYASRPRAATDRSFDFAAQLNRLFRAERIA
jgi:hypothetical protein